MQGVSNPLEELLRGSGIAPTSPQSLFAPIAPIAPQTPSGGTTNPMAALADLERRRAQANREMERLAKRQQAEEARQQALLAAEAEARVKAAEKETKGYAKNPNALVEAFAKLLLESDAWKKSVSLEREHPAASASACAPIRICQRPDRGRRIRSVERQK